MDKVPETYNLLRLNHEVIENLSRLVTGKDVESIIEKLPTNKISGPDSSDGKETACSAGVTVLIPGSERSS